MVADVGSLQRLPRVIGDGDTFDRSPFNDPEAIGPSKAGETGKKKRN
jgi:hypothetical protein